MTAAFAGEFFTTEPPGKLSFFSNLIKKNFLINWYLFGCHISSLYHVRSSIVPRKLSSYDVRGLVALWHEISVPQPAIKPTSLALQS